MRFFISFHFNFFFQFDLFYLSVACAIIPIVFIYLMIFVPESPIFYLMKGNVDKAKESLSYFRSPNENVDQELNAMQAFLAKVYFNS